MRYAVVIERAKGNYSAYVPDLRGCVAVESLRQSVACVSSTVSPSLSRWLNTSLPRDATSGIGSPSSRKPAK